MKKIKFEDGKKEKDAVVIIENQEYNVIPAQIEGKTPLSSFNLNHMQDNIEAAINGISAVITLTETIEANIDYTIPLNYHVENNDLIVFYCGEKLKKNIDYIEVGEAGTVSNTIQFTSNVGDLDMSDVEGFEDFKETLEFVVRGDYSDNN